MTRPLERSDFRQHPHARRPQVVYLRVREMRIVGNRLIRGVPVRPVETAEIPTYAKGLPDGGVEVGWTRVPIRVLPS